MLAAKHAGVLRKRADDVVDDLALTPRTAVVVRDIDAVPADEPDTKHKPFHVSHTRRAQRQHAMNLRGQATVPSGVEDRSCAAEGSPPRCILRSNHTPYPMNTTCQALMITSE